MTASRHTPESPENPSAAGREEGRGLGRIAGDVSGAFADLGTFLPLVLGVLALNRFDPASVLVGFGCFALATAAIYRRPVPVQPMKAVAAIIIAAGLSPQTVAASGVVLGGVLVVLALTGLIERLNRAIPQSVLAGVSLGIGIHLALAGLDLVASDPALGLGILAGVALLMWTPARAFACLAGLAAAVVWALADGSAAPVSLEVGLYFPALVTPGLEAFREAAETVVIPQLALTVTNAVLMTAALAATFFPGESERLGPRRLALTSGGLNLLLAPFGALPMCHGAGGLVVQHKFGARTGLAPALFGLACLVLGLGLGTGALGVLGLVPLAAVGALLVIAGGEMALSKRLFDGRPSCIAVILGTAAVCVLVNVAVGVVAGLAAEYARTYLLRRFGTREAES